MQVSKYITADALIQELMMKDTMSSMSELLNIRF
jgi:hypothetical protein